MALIPVHPGIGLRYLNSEGVPRTPGAANVTLVKTKAWKLDQRIVKIAAGEAEVIESA
jgi:hypothetical protein